MALPLPPDEYQSQNRWAVFDLKTRPLVNTTQWIDAREVSRENPPTKKETDEVHDPIRRGGKPRSYADENFHEGVVTILRHLGGRVTTTREARMLGNPDENHAAYALRHQMILVSCDRDFLDERRFPLVHSPSPVVFDFQTYSGQEVLDTLRCLRLVFVAPQFLRQMGEDRCDA